MRNCMLSGLVGLAGLSALAGEPKPWEHEINGRAIDAETMPDGRRKITLSSGSFFYADASDIISAKKKILANQGYNVIG